MSERPLYWHGGRPGIQRGAFLLPPTITKVRSLSDFGAAGVHRRDRVYLTTSMAAALLYASGVKGGVLYVCEPIGEVDADPDCNRPGLSFQCEKARVLRVVKPQPKQLALARQVLIGGAA